MRENVSGVVAEMIGWRERRAEKIGGRRHELMLQPEDFVADAKQLLSDAAIAGALGEAARANYRNIMVKLAACCVAAAEVEDARAARQAAMSDLKAQHERITSVLGDGVSPAMRAVLSLCATGINATSAKRAHAEQSAEAAPDWTVRDFSRAELRAFQEMLDEAARDSIAGGLKRSAERGRS